MNRETMDRVLIVILVMIASFKAGWMNMDSGRINQY